MFGFKKLMTAMVENMKIIAKEQVNQTELLVKQNHYLYQLDRTLKRHNEFIRTASGVQTVDDFRDEEAFNEFQETQVGRSNALEEMYHGDISIGGLEES